MSDLNIPNEARVSGWNELNKALSVDHAELRQAYARALHTVAPLIAAAAMEQLAAQYPAGVFPETANEIARCAAAGITLDGIQAMAIRERLLAEAKRLRGEQS